MDLFQRLSFFLIIIGQITGFPSEHPTVHHLYNAVSDRDNLGSFIVTWEGPTLLT
jgi:hypothetical protein